MSFTSEFPLPPAYFTDFATSGDVMTPPEVPQDFRVEQLYNGSVVDPPVHYNESTNYKEKLHRLVEGMYLNSIKNLDGYPQNKENLFEVLNDHFRGIFKTLEELREHQARRKLIGLQRCRNEEADNVIAELQRWDDLISWTERI